MGDLGTAVDVAKLLTGGAGILDQQNLDAEARTANEARFEAAKGL